MPGILSDFFAAAQIVSIACSTCVACTSCAEPPLSAVARSYGPTKSPSMPGVDAIVSTHARAAAVSTMAKARVPSLASRMWSTGAVCGLCSAIARSGPQLRSPSGGYFAAPAKRRASEGLLIIGATIASAPKSSARETSAKSLRGIRTTGADSAWWSAPTPVVSVATSQSPCWASSTTAGNPSRAIVSATAGEPSMHQAPKTVSPARRRRARANAGTSAALLDLRDSFAQQFGHLGPNLLLGDTLWLQVLDQLVHDVVIGALLKVRQNHLFCVGFRVGTALSENAGRP